MAKPARKEVILTLKRGIHKNTIALYSPRKRSYKTKMHKLI